MTLLQYLKSIMSGLFNRLTSKSKGEPVQPVREITRNRPGSGHSNVSQDGPQAPVEAQALYNSPGPHPKYKYLQFRRGERLKILREANDNWWQAEHPRTKERGYVPTQYIALMWPIRNEPWFYWDWDRDKSQNHLLGDHRLPPGTFVVRPSSSAGFALDVKFGPRVFKPFRIDQDQDNHYYYIEEEFKFRSIQQLVQHYQTSKSPLLKIRLGKWPVEARAAAPPSRDEWEIDSRELVIGVLIGQGNFGLVKRALWHRLPVAVKTLLNSPNRDGEKDFKDEAQQLKELDHPHIVQLYGVITVKQPYMLVTEYMSDGSLLRYMRKKGSPVDHAQAIDILIQIAAGMEYLAGKGKIHRDLAARNVLIDLSARKIVAKVSDFGLTRNMPDDHYYTSHGNFPVCWSPPEALETYSFTERSDCWSYAVVMFELYTSGEAPYAREIEQASKRPDYLLKWLEQGNRLRQPARCPDAVFSKISNPCFARAWRERPSFTEILAILKALKPDEIEPPPRTEHRNGQPTPKR